MPDFESLRSQIRAFVDERDWSQFHSPKDLAVGLSVEAGELLENFQWRDPRADELARDPNLLQRVQEEVADVFIYTVLLADTLGFDLPGAVAGKLEKNRQKYPVEKTRGKALKWNEL
ncbi:MAG TPA: nucleotide pyrophosphohydrolase [Candidatus Thermoplasmatota archaeon]|nr:nucleotide pyrophosphohydrolase [Candidatus Thermoplasmatota archaeon]